MVLIRRQWLAVNTFVIRYTHWSWIAVNKTKLRIVLHSYCVHIKCIWCCFCCYSAVISSTRNWSSLSSSYKCRSNGVDSIVTKCKYQKPHQWKSECLGISCDVIWFEWEWREPQDRRTKAKKKKLANENAKMPKWKLLRKMGWQKRDK